MTYPIHFSMLLSIVSVHSSSMSSVGLEISDGELDIVFRNNNQILQQVDPHLAYSQTLVMYWFITCRHMWIKMAFKNSIFCKRKQFIDKHIYFILPMNICNSCRIVKLLSASKNSPVFYYRRIQTL